MNRYSIAILLHLGYWNVCYGQQNFFNVPSSDITTPKKLFFQQQFNFYNAGLASNSTFTYGLGKKSEIGFNVLGLTYEYEKGMVFNDSLSPYFPLLALNFQKKWQFSEQFSLAAGTQVGLVKSFKTGIYVYSNAICHLEGTKLVGGLYYTSDSYFGSEQRSFFETGLLKDIGFQLGLEQALIKEKLVFQADFISGKHSFGEVVLGAAYYLTPKWVLSGGYQVPFANSKSIHALVIELTFIP